MVISDKLKIYVVCVILSVKYIVSKIKDLLTVYLFYHPSYGFYNAYVSKDNTTITNVQQI